MSRQKAERRVTEVEANSHSTLCHSISASDLFEFIALLTVSSHSFETRFPRRGLDIADLVCQRRLDENYQSRPDKLP